MPVYRIFSILIVITTALALTPCASYADTAPVDSNVHALMRAEQAGDWNKALQISAAIEADPESDTHKELKAHLAKLTTTVTGLRLAADYHQLGDITTASATLDSTLAAIRNDYQHRDLPLLEAVLGQQKAYTAELFSVNKKQLEQEYARIQGLENSGQLSTAITRLTKLIGDADGKVDPQILSSYQDKLIELQSRKHLNEHPGFFAAVGNAIAEEWRTAAKAIFYIALAILVYVIWRVLARPFRADFIEITLDDQTDAAQDKAEANRALSQEFDQALKRIVSEINEGGDLDGLMDIEGVELSNTQSAQTETAKIAEYLQSDPIQIGVLKFTPKSIFEMFAHMTRTRGKSVLTGSLFKESARDNPDGDIQEFVLHIEQRDLKDKTKTTRQFFEGRGETRESAIEQAAMQLMVSQPDSNVTYDWRSLEALVHAKSVLDNQIEYRLAGAKSHAAAGQPANAAMLSILDRLRTAKTLLQKSLALDPSNWVARYRLANVLRKLGNNRTAYWQYSYVLDLLCSDKQEKNDNLLAYVNKQPTFPFKVFYKKIISRSHLGGMYIKANAREQRETGFSLVTSSLADLELLVNTIGEVCREEPVKNALDEIAQKIATVKRLYRKGPKNNRTIKPVTHSKLQLEKLRDNIYKEYLPDQNDGGEGATPNGKDDSAEPKPTAKSRFSFKNEQIIIKDMIYQINSGLSEILTDLYEYHKEFAEDPYVGKGDALLDEIDKTERWLFAMRMELDDKNRNAYSYSHAIAHNAVGRAHYVKLRELLGRKDKEKYSDDIRHHFDTSESFLRWAIGYHLPAGFAEPYINLASLYLKALEYERLKDYMPTDWMTVTEQYLQQALRLSPENKKAHYLLGRLYQIRMPEDRLLAEEERTTDRAFASKALEQFEAAGEDSFSYYRAGQIYASQKLYEKALTKLDLCLRRYHRFDDPHELYLSVIEKHLEKKLELLAAEYNEEELSLVRQMLGRVMDLQQAIETSCFDGTKLVPGERCGRRLDYERIRRCGGRLKAFERKLVELGEQQKSAKKDQAASAQPSQDTAEPAAG
jgi:hypothetical protein